MSSSISILGPVGLSKYKSSRRCMFLLHSQFLFRSTLQLIFFQNQHCLLNLHQTLCVAQHWQKVNHLCQQIQFAPNSEQKQHHFDLKWPTIFKELTNLTHFKICLHNWPKIMIFTFQCQIQILSRSCPPLKKIYLDLALLKSNDLNFNIIVCEMNVFWTFLGLFTR